MTLLNYFSDEFSRSSTELVFPVLLWSQWCFYVGLFFHPHSFWKHQLNLIWDQWLLSSTKIDFFFSLFLAISVGKGGHDVGRVRLHWRLPNSPPELLSACWRTRSFSGSKCHQVESKHKTHLSEQRFEKLEIKWHFSPKLTQREEWRSLFTSSPQTRQEQRRNQAEHRVG